MNCVTTVLASFVFALSLAGCSDSGYQPLALDSQGLTPAGGVMERVTGSGHLHDPGDDHYRTFSFNATMRDGTVSGEFELQNHGDGQVVDLHGDVTCFTIDGDQAWMGGTVEIGFVDPGPLPPEDQYDVIWAVEDNGQGMNADPDRITEMTGATGAGYADAQEWCDEMDDPEPLGLVWQEVENGNIRISQ